MVCWQAENWACFFKPAAAAVSEASASGPGLTLITVTQEE